MNDHRHPLSPVLDHCPPTLPAHVREHLLERAKAMGIDTSRLLWAALAAEQHAKQKPRV